MDTSLLQNSGKNSMDQRYYQIRMMTSKIEKAISMPHRWPVFAQNNVRELIKLCNDCDKEDCQDVVIEAYRSLKKYFNEIDDFYGENKEFKKECEDQMIALSVFCSKFEESFEDNAKNKSLFESMMIHRKSIRNFSNKKVPIHLLNKAVLFAHKMPSACNRSPSEFYLVKDNVKKEQLLNIHQGNQGFLAPLLGVITVDKNAFFQEDEENTIHFHGGLFTAGLVLGLESLGICSCILNWHTTKDIDFKAHKILDLPEHQIITNLIFIGYKKENVQEAHSPKKVKNLIKII
jgi:nitroreductase